MAFVDQISSLFCEIGESHILMMNSNFLRDVLNSKKLKIRDEDSLLKLLLKRKFISSKKKMKYLKSILSSLKKFLLNIWVSSQFISSSRKSPLMKWIKNFGKQYADDLFFPINYNHQVNDHFPHNPKHKLFHSICQIHSVE